MSAYLGRTRRIGWKAPRCWLPVRGPFIVTEWLKRYGFPVPTPEGAWLGVGVTCGSVFRDSRGTMRARWWGRPEDRRVEVEHLAR